MKKNSNYGGIFENWTITEIRKNNFNIGIANAMYYFRDSTGNEVDLILERENNPVAIEIKAGTKLNSSLLKGLL